MYADVFDSLVRQRPDDFEVQIDVIGLEKIVDLFNRRGRGKSCVGPKSRKLFQIFRSIIEIDFDVNASKYGMRQQTNDNN